MTVHPAILRDTGEPALRVTAVRPATGVGAARATVLLCHGLGEHSGRHLHVAAAYAAAGIGCVLIDLRGHGRSEGPRGHAGSLAEFARDLSRVRQHLDLAATPCFLHGHSMGGLVVMRYAATRGEPVAGVLVSAPWLRLRVPIPPWKYWLGRGAAALWPRLRFSTGVAPGALSRDRAFLDGLPEADLTHRLVSAGLFFAADRAAASALREAGSWRWPLLVVQGGDDPLICGDTVARYVREAGCADKTFRVFPGMRHEPHNDLGREAVLRELVGWVCARSGPGQIP